MIILTYTYQLILLLATLTGIVRFLHLPTPARVLVALLLITCIGEGVSTALAHHRCNNIIVYHFLVIVSYWCYALIYYLLITAPGLRMKILVTPLFYTIIAVVNSLYFEKLNEFPSVNLILYGISLSVYAVLYFKHLMDQDRFEPSLKNPAFLFSIAVLAYYTVETFNWGITRYLISKRVMTLNPIIYFGYIVSCLFYITLGMVILLYKKPVNAQKEQT